MACKGVPLSQPTVAEVRGVCRDGQSLVIELTDYQLPKICIVTGQPVADTADCLIVKCLGLNPSESVKPGVYSSITWGAFIREYTAKLRVGLIPEQRGRLQRSNRQLVWGHRAMWIGVVLGILGGIASVYFFGGSPPWGPALQRGSLVAGGVLCLGGGLILWRRERLATVRRRLGTTLWLPGLPAEVLQYIPPRETVGDLASSIGEQLKETTVQCFLGAALFFAISLGLGLWGLADLREQLSSQAWKDVPGTITSVDVRRSAKAGGQVGGKVGTPQDQFSLELAYTYDVDGKMWQGTRQRFGAAPAGPTQASVEFYAQQYVVGNQVQVYYDPLDPERCSLMRAERPWLSYGWRLIPAAIGVWAVLQGLRWRQVSNRWSQPATSR